MQLTGNISQYGLNNPYPNIIDSPIIQQQLVPLTTLLAETVTSTTAPAETAKPLNNILEFTLDQIHNIVQEAQQKLSENEKQYLQKCQQIATIPKGSDEFNAEMLKIQEEKIRNPLGMVTFKVRENVPFKTRIFALKTENGTEIFISRGPLEFCGALKKPADCLHLILGHTGIVENVFEKVKLTWISKPGYYEAKARQEVNARNFHSQRSQFVAPIYCWMEYEGNKKIEGEIVPIKKQLVIEERADDDLTFIGETKLDYNQKMYLASDIVRSVVDIHFDLAHCDLKPANFLIYESEDGRYAKLSDFGSICAKNDLNHMVATIGTAECWPPEKIIQEIECIKIPLSDFVNLNRKIDPIKCDIWSLGCVLYDLFKDNSPPWGEKFLEITNLICEIRAKEKIGGAQYQALLQNFDQKAPVLMQEANALFATAIAELSTSDETQDIIISEALNPNPAERLGDAAILLEYISSEIKEMESVEVNEIESPKIENQEESLDMNLGH